jgi:hypothetical protein
MQKSLAINPYNLADFTIVDHFPKEIHTIMRIFIAICFGEPTGRIRPKAVTGLWVWNVCFHAPAGLRAVHFFR